MNALKIIPIEKMKPLVPEYISPDTSNIYETSTARMLVQAIGPNTIIKEFDEIRIKVKTECKFKYIHQ